MAHARRSRSEQAVHTRRELLDAAQRRFFRDGYHGTTLDDIADEAGYTKGAVYSAFKSKGGLFLALFEEVGDRRIAQFSSLVAGHETNSAKLVALGARSISDDDSQFLLLVVEFWAHAARDPDLLAAFAETHRRLRSDLAALAPEGNPFDAATWAVVTLALSSGLALERLIDPQGVPDDLMATVQRRLFRTPEDPADG